jgi:hypothetical protein
MMFPPCFGYVAKDDSLRLRNSLLDGSVPWGWPSTIAGGQLAAGGFQRLHERMVAQVMANTGGSEADVLEELHSSGTRC